jgi:AcrR family transcriptional regulator
MATARRGRPPERPDRKESILEAALQAFVDRGFHGTAIPEIAENAGVAAGTIYHYFPTKQALVNELFRLWKGEVAKRVFSRFPQGAPVREQFRVMWHEILAFANQHTTAFAFIELHNHTSYLDAESIAVDRSVKEFARVMVQRAQAEGVVKPLDAVVLMELVFGAFIGLVRAAWEKRVVLTDDVIAGAEAACWDAIAVRR